MNDLAEVFGRWRRVMFADFPSLSVEEQNEIIYRMVWDLEWMRLVRAERAGTVSADVADGLS
jgi:hypothetical protein